MYSGKDSESTSNNKGGEERMDCITIGIAGGTGSGKSTFTNRLKDRFGDEITVLYHVL